MIKKIIAFTFAALAVPVTIIAGVPRAAFATPPCSPDSTTCSPGPGWTKVQIEHVSSSMCMADGGANLDRIWVGLCTDQFSSQTWWARLINNGADEQFTQVGNDGYFHDLGFSGGYFKLEPASDSVYLVPWDESNEAWSYANSALTYWAGSPDQEGTWVTSDFNPFTHWLLTTPCC